MDNAELNIRIGADVSGATRGISRLRDEMGRFNAQSKQTDSSVGKIGSSFKGLGAGLGGLVAAGSLAALGKQILDVTANFEKLGVVLANTLGSQILAEQAFKDIEAFASKTPFSVQEVTESFVKLANQGFVPTTDELRKLGDLAASTGKSFDQLAEAILDAQVGEFERLKEFGIRAADAGDKVRFTFKGVTTEVEKTSGAIREYITSLGDIQGVTGSTEKISATLTGQLSNLGDAFDRLFNSIGSVGKGVFSTILSGLQSIIDGATAYIERIKLISQFQLQNQKGMNAWEGIKAVFGGGKINEAADNIVAFRSALENHIPKAVEAYKKGFKEFAKVSQAINEVTFARAIKEAEERGAPGEIEAIKQAFSDFNKKVAEIAAKEMKPKVKETPFGKKAKEKLKKDKDDFVETAKDLEISMPTIPWVQTKGFDPAQTLDKMKLGLAGWSAEVQKSIDQNNQWNIEFQETAATLQNTLGPAFDNVFMAIMNGEDIIGSLQNTIKAMVTQFIAAAAKAAIFAAILSALPGGAAAGGFTKIFTGLLGGGLGGVRAGGIGAGPQLVAVGTLRGQDILLSVQRTERTNFING